MTRPAIVFLTGALLVQETAFAQFSIAIDAQKDSFYTLLAGPHEGYIHIPHTEYLPMSGPRPSSEADLSADVWAAWDERWLYIYAEVRDDTVLVNTRARPSNDCLELKFDPDPARRAWGGIVNARLSALDSADAEESAGVDNLYPELDFSPEASAPGNYARRRTENGYVLELRLAWRWITVKGRSVSVGPGNLFGLSVTFHESDDGGRDGSIQWSPGMADEVWTCPQLLGTVEFREDHRLKFIRRNSIDPSARPGKTYLSRQRFEDPRLRQLAIENWRYRAGDDAGWARPAFDDSGWELVYPVLRPGEQQEQPWTGIGWFRATIAVDSSMSCVPLTIAMSHAGASEVYVDGALVQKFGTVASGEEAEVPYLEMNPRVITFRGEGDHALAVRYSNHHPDRFVRYNIFAGFRLDLGANVDSTIAQRAEELIDFGRYQSVFTVVPLFLALLHGSLFLYYRRGREHLFFAIAMAGWAVVTFSDFHSWFAQSFRELVTVGHLGTPAVTLALIFVLLTVYEMLLGRIPRLLWVFLVAGVVIPAWSYISPRSYAGIALYVMITLAFLEIVRVFLVAGPDRRRSRWITATGFMLMMMAVLVQLLANLGVVPRMIVYPYGLLVLGLAVSLDLGRSHARTRKDLEEQLRQVRDLSERALEQERRVREEEIARTRLEADNERKTQELQEARKLQLSMLPREVPRVPFLEVATYTQPANEVGGDYYDFRLRSDGSLVVAVGDATGHGMKAGIMVATIKGLFSANGISSDPLAFFRLCTRTIRDMHLGNLYMAMMLGIIRPDRITVSSAGMPPLLVYRHGKGVVDEVILKAMPLGASADFPYAVREVPIGVGDTILFMSDGFAELFNERREVLDSARAREVFRDSADQRPEAVIADLVRAADQWRGGEPAHDDITFVVVRVREQS